MDLDGANHRLSVRAGVKSRITRAILSVTALLVIALGVPLALVVERFYQDRAVADLHRRAAETIAEIALPLDGTELARVAAEHDSPGLFAVFDLDGRRLFGSGPLIGDAPVLQALGGQVTAATGQRELVVASPITERSTETVAGVVRVAEPASAVDRRVWRAWLVIAAVIVLAIAAAAALARAQGRRLAEPVARLADTALGLGRGDFTSRSERSGIPEIDMVAVALDESATRLATLLARERSFSADVSHQLRTPLTGLRLRLELAAEASRDADHLRGALEDVGRLEETVEHLLALSRDRQPIGMPLEVDEVLGALAGRWDHRFAELGRTLRVERADHLSIVRASGMSITQVLDTLIDNGIRHGAGDVTVRSRSVAGGVALEVLDQGPGIEDERCEAVFDRRDRAGHGIGLSLARSITEAEGGRLLLVAARPPCFQLILSGAE